MPIRGSRHSWICYFGVCLSDYRHGCLFEYLFLQIFGAKTMAPFISKNSLVTSTKGHSVKMGNDKHIILQDAILYPFLCLEVAVWA